MLEGKYYGRKAGKEGGEHGGAGVILNMVARKDLLIIIAQFSFLDM